MNITLAPEMNTARKRQAKAWLTAQLASPELADPNVTMGWLSGGVSVYINGQPKVAMHGNWHTSELQRSAEGGYTYFHCGGVSVSSPPKEVRLAILGGIIAAVGLWDELAEQYSQALGRVILEAYRSCCLDMVQAPKPAVKLAFSADKQQVALQYTDEPDVWYLNNGEKTQVDETWQQVAA